MRLTQQLLTRNECYIAGKTIRPRGVMVHSTGANNPRVARYVPGDGVLGINTGGNHWNSYHAGGRDIGPHPFVRDKITGRCKTCGGGQKAVHAFIGCFASGGVGTVQTLPWNRRGWHGASGKKGCCNNTHIAFEICEDGLTDPDYFQAVYREAVELTAFLCKEYGLDPLADGVVICHQEGYWRGIASNHGDVLHWFPKFGKTMDDFRADVARELKGEDDEMLSYEQWKAYMEQYRRELAAQPASMPDLLADAKTLGLTDGTRPRDLVTREEAAVMARAAAKK